MLSKNYPDYPWQPWRFDKVSNHLMDDDSILEALIDHVESSLGLLSLKDWQNVSYAELEKIGAKYFLEKSGSIIDGLKKFRPQYF